MSTQELLGELRRLGVKLRLVDGELKVSAPKGALTAELRGELKQHRAAILAYLGGEAEEESVGLPLADRSRPLPLSFTQQRLWFLDQLHPDLLTYNMWVALRLRGELDEDALEWALAEIVRRHDVLRTRFVSVEGVPQQEVDPDLTIPLVRMPAPPGMAEDLWREEFHRELMDLLCVPYDLATGPLVRMHLVSVAKDEHVLLTQVHHIVFDGLSKAVYARELAQLYEARLAGEPSPLPALPVQYADYAAWQQEFLSGEHFERQMDYWRDVLQGELPVLALPTDKPRPTVETFAGSVSWRVYERSKTDALTRLAGEEGTTLFVALLALYKTLLLRYTGQEDLIVGTAVGNRSHVDTEGLLGYFVNTLALRTDLSGDPSFRELMRRERDVTLGAMEHQDTPFERLVDELVPNRNMSVSPIFQTLFVLDEDTGESRRMANFELEMYDLELPVSRTDLVFVGFRDRNYFQLTLEYNTDLFEAETIERMQEHIAALLDAILENPDAPLSELEMLTAEERLQVLEEWNPAPAEIAEAPVYRLFEEQAARRPDAPALALAKLDGSGVEDELTYRELDERANRLAQHLVSLGVGVNELVGLSLPRSVDMVAAQLAIQKAGAAYVPLDPEFPAERLAYMVEDAGLTRIVTTQALAARQASDSVVCIAIDADAEAIAACASNAPDVAPDANRRMYVIYTSGSTGRPKGVELAHRSVVNFLESMAHEPGLSEEERLLALTTLSFDISVLETMLPLIVGAQVIVAPKEAVTDGERLRGIVEGLCPDVLQATPATWRMLSMAGWQGTEGLRMLCGGEALPRELVEELLPRGAELWNLYGPTETTVWSAVRRCDSAEGAVPIGHPIANTRIYILDANRRPVPPGVPGELWIGGEGLALGYLGREELTAERFVPDPFVAGQEARMYRTGDLGRWLARGELECLGRVDNQVKLRGYRIELGEIESVAEELDVLEQAVAVVQKDEAGERLVLFVLASDGFDADALRSHMQGQLPAYMVPAVVQRLDALPLTPNKKVDRRALVSMEVEAPERAEFVEPRNDTERSLAEIFAEILKVDEIGIDDDFFALGGNSLLTTQVMARVRRDFEAEVSLIEIFEAPTVRGLAARIGESSDAVGLGSTLQPVDRDGDLPLSYTQQRLWFLDRLEPGLTAYNIQWAWKMLGPLDVERLERALSRLVERHEILRTRFGEREGEPVQVIDPPTPFSLEVVDAAGGEVAALLLERMEAPFDLAAGPLFAPFLVRTGDEEHVFCVRAHHTVWDGWSGGVFRKELVHFYEEDAPTESLPPLPVQYADFAAWQRGDEGEAAFGQELDYWKAKLGGELPTLELPLDKPRPPVVTYRGANAERKVGLKALQRLDELAAKAGATRFMALLTLYQMLLARWTHTNDVVVGTPVASRNRPELEPLIGFFANTLALRTDLGGDPSFLEACARVRTTVLDAMKHQDVPFEELVDELGVERNLSTTPIFQTLFVLEEGGDAAGDAREGMGEVRFDSVELETRVARTDMTLWAQPLEDGLLFWSEYNVDLFEARTAERFLESLETLLEDALERPEAPLSELEVVSAASYATLAEWNATNSAYPRDSSIVAEFEARVREHENERAATFLPGSALVGEKTVLSYAELNARANRMAHHLIELGVRPGELVGLCAERSPAMLVAILAILKSGGAYLPLDPAYPEERLAFLLEDAEVRILLVEDALLGRLPGFDGERVSLSDEALFEAHSSENPGLESGPESLAYAMFTSGSTGRPKGVLVEHKSVLRLVLDPNYVELGADQTLLHFAPISFDASTFEVWGALLRGGHLVVYPPSQPSLEDLGRVLVEERVTTAWLTAGLFSLMVEERLDDLGCLQQLLAGGDVLPVAHVNRVLERYPNLRLINGYGPTENTTFTACYPIHEAGRVQSAVPIGRAVSDTRIHVVDSNLRPVPIGVVGELLAAGDGLARGYLKRPELTAERFVECDFPGATAERCYRVGDRVRHRHDGVLEFLGRTDDQVKVRGFRIELGEIEACLGQAEGVSECVVVVREDVPGDKRIVGYAVPEVDAALEGAELRGWCEARLPGFMVPSHFVVLDELPLSPNGKVDRRALPSPTVAAGGDEAYVAPRDENEERLAAIWAEVLGLERVGIHDNFFELGGNSLLSTKAVSRTRQAFGRELALRDLFLQPTVAGLAARLGASELDADYEAVFDRSLIPLQKSGTRIPLFLVSGAHANEDDFLRFVGAMLPYMGADQPIYGFKARGLDGVRAPHASAEEMAADYVREMREFRPEGPYLLAGNCVGGIVAYEMARQLEEAGEEVAMVALLDTTSPRDEYRAFVNEHYRFWKLERFTGHLKKVGELSWGQRIDYVWSRVVKKFQRKVPLSDSQRRRAHVEMVERRYSQVLAEYSPRPYRGRVTLIINEEFQREVPNGGWHAWVHDLDVHVVAGDHVTRLSMNGRENADILRACIREALAKDQTAPAVGRTG